MDFTYVISAEHNIYPNMTVEEKYLNGEFAGWRITANEGYVFYDTTAQNYETDENGNDVPVIYYYTLASKNKRYNWDNFHYVAVPRDSVDENYIFGVGGNNHETI